MLYDVTHRMGRTLGITSVLLLLEVSRAFSPKPNHTSDQTSTGTGFDVNDALKIFDQTIDAGIGTDVNINLEKARDFACHYGKYSIEEVEHMRNDLHAHRLLNDSPSDVLFLERILEDELTSQLTSLKEHMPEPYLFRYPDYHYDDETTGLFANPQEWSGFEPPSTTTTTSTIATTSTEEPKKVPSSIIETKRILGEGALESLVICIALGFLMLSDQLA